MTPKEWSGSPDPTDPDNFWVDDDTGERVSAATGERFPTTLSEQLAAKRADASGVGGFAFVVYVDEVGHGFNRRADAAKFATQAMFNPDVTRVECPHLRLTRNCRRFV